MGTNNGPNGELFHGKEDRAQQWMEIIMAEAGYRDTYERMQMPYDDEPVRWVGSSMISRSGEMDGFYRLKQKMAKVK